jgi:hypothetical protein
VADVGPDVIVHQATAFGAVDSVNPRHFDLDFAPTNRLRRERTDHLLAAGQTVGVRRFVAQGFVPISYARTGGPIKTEQDPLDPAPARQLRETWPRSTTSSRGSSVRGGRRGRAVLGAFYGPGTAMAPGEEMYELIRERKFPLVDDDPAPVAEWLPALARTLGAKKPRRVPSLVVRLLAGEAAVTMMTSALGASNATRARVESGASEPAAGGSPPRDRPRAAAAALEDAGMTPEAPRSTVGGVPLPCPAESVVVVEPACPEPGYWAGAPSALVVGSDTWLAYRERDPQRRGGRVVVAQSGGGERFDPVVVLDRERFGAASLERPALALTADGRWRLYVSCATPGSKHWRIDLLEARAPARLGDGDARTVLPGDGLTAVKDPVIRFAAGRWHGWVCCHPLAEPGEEDRMLTRYVTSRDGVEWTWRGAALTPQEGAWDARGARVSAVLSGAAYYDGRASKDENFHERTGVAAGIATAAPATARLRAHGEGPIADVRYVDVVGDRAGGARLFYEAPRRDGAHELRTERKPSVKI